MRPSGAQGSYDDGSGYRRKFYMPPFGSRQKGSPALPWKINL